MLLWATLAVLTVAATAIVVWPLLSRRPAPAAHDDDLERRLAVFRDRREEIGREHTAGRVTDIEAEHAQADLLRQMTAELPPEVLATSDPRSHDAPPASRRPRAPVYVGLAVAVLVPLVALGVYRGVGSPELALAQRDAALPGASVQARFDALVAQIQDRLEANPRDGEAWAVLAEARKMVGDHAAAVEAFGHAVELVPPNSRLLADYAESVALLAGGNFEGRPTELLKQALRVDPQDQKAVALMGAARYRAGDLPEARRYLRQLLATLPPDSDYAAQIAQVVARIGTELGEPGTPGTTGPGSQASSSTGAPSASAPAPAASGPLASGAPAAPAAPTTPTTPTTPAASTVRGKIVLAPALAQRVPPGATLFIVARASEGPRIPVAVLRIPAPQLPLDFELGDANAMDPSRLLSSTAAISLEARLSGSGTAMRSAGDLYGTAATVKPGASGVTIEIDKVVGS